MGNPGCPAPAKEHYELELDLEDATELLEAHFGWAERRKKQEGDLRSDQGGSSDGAALAEGGGEEIPKDENKETCLAGDPEDPICAEGPPKLAMVENM